MPSRLLSLLVLSLATSGLLAQSTPQIQEPEPSVQSLLERIQRLEKRIGELEDHQRTQAAVGAESSGPAVVESGNTQSGTVPSSRQNTNTRPAQLQSERPNGIILPFKSGGSAMWTSRPQTKKDQSVASTSGSSCSTLLRPFQKK